VPLIIKAAGKTDIGLVRSGNEDYLYVDDDHNLYVVCDGMGGHQAGEVASMSAAQVLETVHHKLADDILGDPRLEIGKTLPDSGNLLLRGIRLANRSIFNKAATTPSMSGMGTTVVGIAFEGDMMSVAHVGDSRAYRLDAKKLTPLTNDHSWVSEMQATHNLSQEEAESLVGKNVITRALGVRDTVEVDYRLMKVEPGQTFILCSDGLCGFAADDEIFDVANRVRDDLDKIVDNLVQLANDRGGNDNVTVIAARVEEVEAAGLPEVDVFTLPSEPPELLAAEDEWLEKIKKAIETQPVPAGRSKKKGGPSKVGIALIFVVFAAIAWAVIYFLGR